MAKVTILHYRCACFSCINRFLCVCACVCMCRDCPDVRMDELKPFSVPLWMVEKMQRAMEAQRDADLWPQDPTPFSQHTYTHIDTLYMCDTLTWNHVALSGFIITAIFKKCNNKINVTFTWLVFIFCAWQISSATNFLTTWQLCDLSFISAFSVLGSQELDLKSPEWKAKVRWGMIIIS